MSTRLVFFCACLGMLLFGVCLITLGSVATPLREKFAMDATTSGTLFSILPVGILLGSLLFGPVSDRYGYKAVLVISCVLIASGFQGIAQGSSLAILKVCILVFGVGGGAINGATNAVVADISDTNKGANLSLLGVFFAVGALGMPFVLGVLEDRFQFDTIIATVGLIPLLVAFLYLLTRFPPPKHVDGIPLSKAFDLLKESLLITIGFFLFCVSSFEGIMNNWTTTYLTETLSVSNSQALYALSLYVAGMAVMRLLLGIVFRAQPARTILLFSFVFLFLGCVLVSIPHNYAFAVTGLVMVGIGLASGFPVMLGFVGSLYPGVSATAFSLVLTIALIGNMLVNFIMGLVADAYGVRHLFTIAFMLLTAMFLLSGTILKKTKNKHV